MARSNKAVVWSLFAAGGTVATFIMPALVTLTLLVALGHAPATFTYDGLHAIAAHWAGKVALFAIVFLCFWHSAHRLRITLHDFGVRSDMLVAAPVYLAAAIGTIACIVLLLKI